MKKLLLVSICSILMSASAFAETPSLQVGGDFIIPYRVDSPKGRLGMLLGGHAQAYIMPAMTADFAAMFGIEDNGFADKPIYMIPGLSFYLPSLIVQPYLSANVPILINNGKDIGVQAAGGAQFGLLPGVLLRYSVDVAYYFDAKAYIVNWVHAGVAVSF